MDEMEKLKQGYRTLWNRLGFESPEYPLATEACGDGTHAEFRDGVYRYIVSERSDYVYVQETADLDEMLFWIAMNITSGLSLREVYQRPHSDKRHDQRDLEIRQLQLQVEMLRRIDISWREKRELELRTRFAWFPGALVRDENLENARAWQSRSLAACFPRADWDCFPIRVVDEDAPTLVHVGVGIDASGAQVSLGAWITRTGGAGFWREMLEGLRQRGVTGIGIAGAAGTSGFAEAIAAVYPDAVVTDTIDDRIARSVSLPLRRVTKKLGSFPTYDDDALLVLFYLRLKGLVP